PDGNKGKNSIDHPYQNCLKKGRFHAYAYALEDLRGIVNYRIDPGDLRKQRQNNAYDQGHSIFLSEEFPEAPSFFVQSSLDLIFYLSCLRPIDLQQYLPRFRLLPVGKEPARAFRNKEQQSKEDSSRNDLRAKHPAPA